MPERTTHALRWVASLLPFTLIVGQSALDIAIAVLGLCFLIQSSLTREWSWLRVWWVYMGLLLAAYMGLRGVLTAPDRWENLVFGIGWVRLPLAAAALAFWLLPDPATRRRMLRILAGVMVFLVADTAWQFFHGEDIFGNPAIVELGVIRLTGPYAEPRVGMVIAWLTLPVLLGTVQRQSHPAWWLIPLASSVAVVVFLTGERMALLLLLMGLLGVCLWLRPLRRALVIAVGVFGIAACLLLIVQPSIYTRHITRNQEDVGKFWQSVYGRTWKAATQVGGDYPFFGAGVRQFQPVCQQERYGPITLAGPDGRCPRHPHNTYLSWWAEYGILGLGLFSALAFGWLRDGWRARAQMQADWLLLGLFAALCLRLWPLSVTPNPFAGASTGPMWLMIGWFYAQLQANAKNR